MIEIMDSKVVQMVAPASITTTVTGTVLDTVQSGMKFDWATVIFQSGTVSTAIAIGGLKIQESDDNSNWVDVAGTSNVATVAASGQTYVYQLDVRKRRRYLRISVAGTSTGIIASATGLLSRAKEAPFDRASRGATVEYII